LDKWDGRVWTGFKWFKYGPVAGSCGHGNEPSGPIKDRGNSWLTERLLASQEGLWCMELIIKAPHENPSLAGEGLPSHMSCLPCFTRLVEFIKIVEWSSPGSQVVSKLSLMNSSWLVDCWTKCNERQGDYAEQCFPNCAPPNPGVPRKKFDDSSL
jgi:hypothetical protein